MLKSAAKVGSRDTITTTCEEHMRKPFVMFCQDHHVVCCTICVVEKHRRCENVDYIPKIAVGFSKRKDASKLKSDLQKSIKELTKLKSSRQKDQTRIQQERDHVLIQIRDARRRINAMFDKLEKIVTDGAQQRHQTYNGTIQTDLGKCDDAIRRIEAALKDLDDVDTNYEAQLFVEVKRGIENLGELCTLVGHIQERQETEQIKFTIDAGIETYVASLERLGTFVDEMRGAGKLQIADLKANAMVKMVDDSMACNIDGSCFIPDGGALLTDNYNNKLKRLDAWYRVTDSCHIKDPQGVCYIPHTNEAAICQGDGPVHIVPLGKTMTVTRSIRTNHYCFGVSYNNGQLYVGQYHSKVHLYDFVSGAHKSTIHTNGQGQEIFSDHIRHIATSPDGTRIWVADVKRRLIQLDKSGNILRTVTNDELNEPWGVCVGRGNGVLAFGRDSRSILQLGPDGDKVSTLIRADDLPVAVRSICYDKDRALLLVTMLQCNHVKVFHIK